MATRIVGGLAMKRWERPIYDGAVGHQPWLGDGQEGKCRERIRGVLGR